MWPVTHPGPSPSCTHSRQALPSFQRWPAESAHVGSQIQFPQVQKELANSHFTNTGQPQANHNTSTFLKSFPHLFFHIVIHSCQFIWCTHVDTLEDDSLVKVCWCMNNNIIQCNPRSTCTAPGNQQDELPSWPHCPQRHWCVWKSNRTRRE